MRTPADGPVIELDRVPALGRLYARGVAGSLTSAVRRSRPVRADHLPTTRIVVHGVRTEAAHLSDYQHLVGEPAADALPAGFVHVLTFPVATALMVREEFPLPLLGLIHLANRVEQRRVLRLDDELSIEVHAENLAPHRSGVSVDLVATVHADDDVAWVGRSTYLAKGIRLADDGTSGRTPEPDEAASPAARRPTEEQAMSVPTGQWRLTADVGRRYAAVSGDRNPIHTSALAAKAFGFPRAIAHGMYTAARALADIGPARGETFTWDVTFATPVLLPSDVAVRVADHAGTLEVTAWRPRSGRHHLTCAVTRLS